jgi:hypothetical protein
VKTTLEIPDRVYENWLREWIVAAIVLDIDEETTHQYASTGLELKVKSAGYGECMARMVSTTIRLHEEDVRALKRARAAGHSASELVRKGLRVVASRYYSGRRLPSTRLFESTDIKLGEESQLFQDTD